MFFEFIDRIRQKPRAVRKRYAFMGAVIFIGVVTMLWLFTLPARFASILSVTEEGIAAPTVPPFSSLWGSVSERDREADSTPTTTAPVAVATSTPVQGIDTQLILSEETLEQLRGSLGETATGTIASPSPRTVQIATTSATREAATE